MITAPERRELIRTAHASEQFFRTLAHVLKPVDGDLREAVNETVKLQPGATVELNILASELIKRGASADDIQRTIGEGVDTDVLHAAGNTTAECLAGTDT